MTRATLGTIVPSTTSGTQLAALLNNREIAENSGHSGTGRPAYATAGMVYTDSSFTPPKLYLAVGPGPTNAQDIDLSILFSDQPGTIRVTAEVRLAAGWLWANGAEQPRITYPALFNAICPAFTGTVTNASATITAVSENFLPLGGVGGGLIGAEIEGLGIPADTLITGITASTITLSKTAISTNAATPLRIFPHGNGNGSNTFNVPNCKGRVIIGRADMGGADSGLITVAGAGFDGTRLGANGGFQTVPIAIANLPNHTHPISLSGSAAVTSAGGDHSHTFGGSTGADGVHAHVPPAGSSAFFVDVPDPTGNLTVGAGTRAKFVAQTQLAGNHAHAFSGTTSVSSGAHSHVVTLTLGATSSNTVGAVGTPINKVPPSIVENVVIKT